MELQTLLDDTMAGWARERPDLDFTVMGTFLRLGLLSTVGVRALEDALATHDLNLGEFDVLAALRRSGSGTAVTPSTLAKVAMVSPGGMTNRLDRLERAGLIERRPDPSDRRGSLVRLTRRGRSVADRGIETVLSTQAALAAGIPAAERARFDATLDKLLARLDQPDR